LPSQVIEINRVGCNKDEDEMERVIREYDGKVDVIGLEGVHEHLTLQRKSVPCEVGQRLVNAAEKTPVVTGSGIASSLERWGVKNAGVKNPGIFSEKRVLLVPGMNHPGYPDALSSFSSKVEFADTIIYYAMGCTRTMDDIRKESPSLLKGLADSPIRR
jgi:hypothetical protein